MRINCPNAACLIVAVVGCTAPVRQSDWQTMTPSERNSALFETTPRRWLRLRDALVQFVAIEPDTERAEMTVPVLFVHGLAGSMGVYGRVLPNAGERQPVFALDLPGFGSSVSLHGRHTVAAYVEDLVDFIRTVAGDRVHLVCHSLGGQVCLWLALDHPDLVETLALIDAAGTYDPRAFVEHMSRGLLGSVRPEKDPLMQLVMGSQDDLLPHLLGFDPLMLAALSSFDANLGARVRQLRVPTLIIWGEHDELFGLDVALSLKENIVGSELRVVAGAGHSPQVSHPDQVLAWLNEFQARNKRHP